MYVYISPPPIFGNKKQHKKTVFIQKKQQKTIKTKKVINKKNIVKY